MRLISISIAVLLAINTVSCVQKKSYKILGLFFHPGKSHFDVFEPLLEELARRGHDVTVISHFARPRNDSLKYKGISIADATSGFLDVVDVNTVDLTSWTVVSELVKLSGWGLQSCENALRKPDVRNLINSDEKFDLILTELFNNDCSLGFVHKFNAPFIALSSHQIVPWGNPRFNNPDNPSYIPVSFIGLSPNMNFAERVKNTLVNKLQQIIFYIMFTLPTQGVVERTFGPGVPPLNEIAGNTAALLVNTHYSLHGSRPYLPGIVEVGGLQIRGNKPLPKDVEEFLNGATEGALFFSWGSMIKAATLPEEKLNAILKVLGSIRQRVIWKWEVEELKGKPKNLMVKKWLPQFDILSHPNVKGYLAHGGLLGLSEATHAGVPQVIVPFYGDQFHNAAAATARGMAVTLQYVDLNEDTLRDALNKIFNDTSYYENAQAVSRAYRDRPASALETAVWWSEYIARGNGLKYLRSAGKDLAWYQYHLLDVIAFVALVTLAIILVVFFTVRTLLRAIFGKATKKIEVNGKAAKKRN